MKDADIATIITPTAENIIAKMHIICVLENVKNATGRHIKRVAFKYTLMAVT